MTRDKRKKPVKKAEPSESADTVAGRMRRLADAIAALLDNPITVRMQALWGKLTRPNRYELALAPPDYLRRKSLDALSASDADLEEAVSRRQELAATFAAARLDIREDDAVFLEHAISCLPDTWRDAWPRDVDMSDETLNKLRELGRRLGFRADTAERGVAKGGTQRPVEQTTPPTHDVCTIESHQLGIGSVVCVGQFTYHITRKRCIEFIERAKSGNPVKCPKVRTFFQHDRQPARKTRKDSGENRSEDSTPRDHEVFADRHVASAGKGRYCIVPLRQAHAQ